MDTTEQPANAAAPVVDLAAWKAKRDLVKLAEAADWGTIAQKLTRYAAKRIGTRPLWDDPEDLAQEAIKHFFGNMTTWDPERVPLLRHLASVLNGILVDRRRRGPNRRTAGKEEGPEAPEIPERPAETGAAEFGLRTDREDPHQFGGFRPAGLFCARETGEPETRHGEEAASERDFAAEVIRRTQAGLARDALALDVLAQFAQGRENPKEQALALGRSLLEVLAARKRLERHMKQVRAELEGVES